MITEYSHENINYNIALEFARIQVDAFKDDPIMLALVPPKFRFGKDMWPHTGDVEQLKSMLDRYERFLHASARRFYLDVCSNPRHRILLMQNPDRKYVAGTYWVLPKYLDLPAIPLHRRVANFFRNIYYKFLNVLAFWRLGHPLGAGELLSEIEWGKKKTGALDDAKREQELVDSNPKQLQECAYPKNLTYYLNLMCVRADEHKMGYGRKMLEGSLAKLGPYLPPPHIYGPAKASLMSAPPARGFYLACGWEIGAVADHMLPDGTHSPHTFYFKNLPTKERTRTE